ncbi:MAG: glutaredoxin domain-containing protein, partial [Streptomyces albidoflavus]
MEIWINPRCSKCRSATAALDEAGIEYTVRRYLDDPPTRAEIVDVLARLDLEPWHVTRTAESDATAVK